MKRLIVSTAAALSLSLFTGNALAQSTPMPPVGWAPEGSPAATYGQLKVSGSAVQSEKTNAAVQLRGMSLGWSSDMTSNMKPSDFYNERVVAWLAYDWGVSLVRAAVGVSDQCYQNNPCTDCGGAFKVCGLPFKGNEAAHTNYVQNVVNAAIWQGIYVIIDWHSHYAHDGERSAAETFFGDMAKIYKDYPNVIYEIYNEPISNDWSGIKSYATAVIDKIRESDTKNLIIVGTPKYSSRVDQAASSPITGKTNIAYAMHFYCDHGDNSSDGHVPFSSTTGIPIFASEFGLSKSSGNEQCGSGNSFSEAAAWLEKLDARNISWANWQVNSRGETSSILKGATGADYQRLHRGKWTTSDLAPSGVWMRNKLRGYGDSDRKYKIVIEKDGEGTVTGGSNIGVFDTVTLKAEPGSGQRFEGWLLNGVGVETNPYKLEVFYNREGKAVFFPDNLIKNSTFTVLGGWEKRPVSGNLSPDMDMVGGELVVAMGTSPGTAANVRVQHPNTSLTTGKRYKLTFDASATQARTMRAAYRTGDASSGHKFLIGDAVALKAATTDTYEREFNMDSPTTTAGYIAFYIGGQQGGIKLDNVKLVEIGNADPGKPNPTEGDDPPDDPCDAGDPTTECCASNSDFPGCQVGVAFSAVRSRNAKWSVSRTGGGLQLRGPAEAGARVSFYDVRGKLVRKMAAVDGLTLGAGVPAGSYIMLVKDRAGKETLRMRVVLAR